VTITATDASGNSSTCSATITVVDTTVPTIVTCASNQTAEAVASCGAPVPNFTAGVIATDNCTSSLTITQSPLAGSTANFGATTVTITVADAAGNTTTCTATFTVVDTTAPTVTTCPPAQTASANALGAAVLPNLSSLLVATDNCAVTQVIQFPPAGTLVPIGTISVSLAVLDAAGNTGGCLTHFQVVDTTAPTITVCASSATLEAASNCSALIPSLTAGVTANDNSGNVTVTQSPAAGAVAAFGANTVTITATDAAGNSTTCTATITVVDTTAPSITTCAASQTIRVGANNTGVLPDLRSSWW